MKYLPLIWAALWRKPLRTILTTLALIAAFTLVGLAEGVDAGLRAMRNAARTDTVTVQSRFGPPMPYAYKQQLAEMPGVKSVVGFAGMGGLVNGDQQKRLNIQFAEDGGFNFFAYLDVTPAQIAELRANRSSIIVGKTTADTIGVKAGDRVTIPGLPKVDGSRDWPFDVLAVVDRKDGVANSAFVSIGNFEYLNENRAQGKDMVPVLGVIVNDPDQAITIARAIEDKFANSPAPTRTQVDGRTAEQNYEDNNFPEMVNAVVGATVFMVLLMTFNSLMQSFRERIPELGTLKAIGFSDGQVLRMIVTESMIQCVIGAVVGLVLAWRLIPWAKGALGGGQGVQFMVFNWWVAAIGLVAACVVALVSAALPGWRALRMEIVNALATR